MTRISQGEKLEEEPPFEIVDGRSDKIRAVDSYIGAYAASHGVESKRPSELKREDGLQLVKKFGIAVCPRRPGVRNRSKRFPARSCVRPCSYLTVVKNGVKLPRCRGCHARVWIKYNDVVFQHDDLRVIKGTIQNFRAWCGRHPRAILSPALFNRWAWRVEEKLTMGVFHDHLPWNLENFSGVAHG